MWRAFLAGAGARDGGRSWPRQQERPSALPFVSVVVPAYNSAAFLPRCLGSLFAQSYPMERYEIILVDDGSTDETGECARQLGERWAGALRVISKANGGPASARNAGIRAATGDLVAFTDSDCIADPDWVERLVAALRDDPMWRASAARSATCRRQAGWPISSTAPRSIATVYAVVWWITC